MTPYVVIASAIAIAMLVAATAWFTASEYKNLPDRVPLSFWFDGTPIGYGPRGAIWTVPIIQALIVADIAFVVAFPGRPWSGSDYAGTGIAVVCMFAMTAIAQRLLIKTAQTADLKLPFRQFWIPFAILLALAILSVTYL